MITREDLEEQIDQCSWHLLDKNIERGAVFLISEKLDLIEAGIAVAGDDSSVVKSWLESGDFKKVEMKMKDQFEKSTFDFIILQPYVLVKALK